MKTTPGNDRELPARPTSPLDAFFVPGKVALIGASEKPGTVGRALLENLHSFPGRILPVNPRHDFLLDLRAYPDLASLPERPDLAIIAVRAGVVPEVVRQCVDTGVKAAVVISAGFRECGAAGAALEREVRAEARRGALRLLGPNSLGLMSPHAGLNASFAAVPPPPGHIAFISQSGALCSAVLDWSRQEQVGFSAFISLGNMVDVGWADLLGWLGDDPRTHSILLYMESMNDAPAFMAAAARASVRKPVLVLKAGRTAEAAAAVVSHTGQLAGRDEVFDAAFRRTGLMRVDSVPELCGLAEMLAAQAVPAGSSLAIVTNAGGPGALATDALVTAGGRLAKLSHRTLVALNELLPPHWSRGNPVDVLGDASPERFASALEIVAKEPAADGILAILTPQAMSDPTGLASRLPAIARGCNKPFFAAWMGGDIVTPGRRILHEAGMPVFEYPDVAARSFRQVAQIGELQGKRHRPGIAADIFPVSPHVAEQTRALLARIQQAGRTLLTVHESMQILVWHGIRCVETLLAGTADDAVAGAERLGYPVAIKLHSKAIAHKSDVGGVRLGVGDATGVRSAWEEIRHAVIRSAGHQHFQGVTVQPMIPHDERELILGSSTDDQFGPVLLFGAGGRLAEIQHDYALELAPLDADLARRLVERIRLYPALRGARGLPAVDLAELDELLIRFSRLVVSESWIKEIDLNPLVVRNCRLMALDARIVLHAAHVPRDVHP